MSSLLSNRQRVTNSKLFFIAVKVCHAFSDKLFHHRANHWLAPFLYDVIISNLDKRGCFIKPASGQEKLSRFRAALQQGINCSCYVLKEVTVTNNLTEVTEETVHYKDFINNIHPDKATPSCHQPYQRKGQYHLSSPGNRK